MKLQPQIVSLVLTPEIKTKSFKSLILVFEKHTFAMICYTGGADHFVHLSTLIRTFIDHCLDSTTAFISSPEPKAHR